MDGRETTEQTMTDEVGSRVDRREVNSEVEFEVCRR